MSTALGRAALWWVKLPPKQKIAIAYKLGMWTEYAGERAYNFLRRKSRSKNMPYHRRRMMPKRPFAYQGKWHKKRRRFFPSGMEVSQDTQVTQNESGQATTNPHSYVFHANYKSDGALATTTSTDIGTLTTWNPLLTIIDGTDHGDRIGDRIKVLSMALQGHFHNPNTANNHALRLRVMLLQNKFPFQSVTDNFWFNDGSTLSPSDYSGTGSSRQLNRCVNTQKFHVHYDKTFNLPVKGTGDTNPKDLLFNAKVKLDKIFTFNNEALAHDSVYPNIHWSFFIEGDGDLGPSLITPVEYTLSSRVNYIDK